MSGVQRSSFNLPLVNDLHPLAGHGCYNRQSRVDERREFEDPITYEEITDPVMDECGHNFNRTTIDIIFRQAITGFPVQEIDCPISRQPIHRDRMVTNLFMKNAIDESRRRSAEVPDTEESNVAETPISSDSNMATIIDRFDRMELYNRMRCNRLEEKIDRLDTKVTIQGKQLNNVLNMSWCDRLSLVIVPCSDVSGIMNRGLTNDEIRLVNQLSDEQLPSSANPGAWDASCTQPAERVMYYVNGAWQDNPS